MDDYRPFLRELRSKLGMTQEDFAQAMGMTVGTVNRWETGRFRPSRLARLMIAELARKHGIELPEPTESTPGAARSAESG
jgi:DNA-binding transcriptional regulator YiaG